MRGGRQQERAARARTPHRRRHLGGAALGERHAEGIGEPVLLEITREIHADREGFEEIATPLGIFVIEDAEVQVIVEFVRQPHQDDVAVGLVEAGQRRPQAGQSFAWPPEARVSLHEALRFLTDDGPQAGPLGRGHASPAVAELRVGIRGMKEPRQA